MFRLTTFDRVLKAVQMMFFMLLGFALISTGVIMLLKDDGSDITNSQNNYILSYVGMMLMIFAIPFCLKIHKFDFIKKKIENEDKNVANHYYFVMSVIRLLTLFVVMIVNMIAYFIYDIDSNGFCILITVLAYLFCIPSRNKMYDEMGYVVSEDVND